MKYPRKEIEPGEWETDEQGRRFRRIGSCIEYEPVIRIDGIEIPESELSAYHERKKAIEQAQREAARNAVKPAPARSCPFARGLDPRCIQEQCALYVDGCALAKLTNKPPAKDTKGLKCPLHTSNLPCRDDCALYRQGCALTAITTNKRK